MPRPGAAARRRRADRLPGLVDLHTHLREPGREDAETVADRHRGGGARRLHRGARDGQHRPGRRHRGRGRADLAARPRRRAAATSSPVGAVTAGLGGSQLAELGAMADSAARVRVFSDDGRCVPDAMLMRRALEYVKAFDGVIAQHAQEPRLTEGAQVNEGEMSARLGPGRLARGRRGGDHRPRLPARRARRLGAARLPRLDGRLGGDHPVGEVQGLAGDGRGDPASPAAHRRAGRGLRPGLQGQPAAAHGRADVAALRAGLADGTIDCVATDHAPHPVEEKETEWSLAAFGMTGLETALRVVHEAHGRAPACSTGPGSPTGCRCRPAAIGRAAGGPRPAARRGAGPANLVLYDPAAASGRSTRPRTPPAAGTRRSPG